MAKAKRKQVQSKSPSAALDVRPAVLRRSFWMFVILFVGLGFRSYLLTMKPVHFDEGINGHFVSTMWRDGFYKYDPTNFHGPLYFYILMIAERIFGFGIFGYRFVTGLINLAAIWVVGLHRRFAGRAAIYAAFILVLSPAFVFYSRYSIHESLFILSQVAFSYGYFLYREEKSLGSLWWMAAAIVGLITTKETFFIFLGTWAIAVAIVRIFDRTKWRASGYEAPANGVEPPPLQSWIAVAMVSATLVLALFTGFFLHLEGARDMVSALLTWTNTGTAHTGHEKIALYFFDLMVRFEWPCLIGLCATPILFFFVNRAMRILILVGFGTFLAYSIIPYKTPWLILNILWPLAIAAGAVIARLLPPFKFWRGLRTGFAVLTFASIFFSAKEMWRLSFRDFAKPSEPYVYVQSTVEFKKAVDTILAHVQRRPEDVSLRVFAMSRDSWPLPYLLEPLTNVSWGHEPTTDLKTADVILADAEDRASVESRMQGSYFVLPFKIRDAYQDGYAYLRKDMFKDDVATGSETFEGKAP